MRSRLKIFLFTLLTVSVVLVAGMVIPGFLIGTGVEQFAGERRELARQAVGVADSAFVGEPDSILVTASSVESVRRCPGTSDPESYGFSSEVRLYTIFGVTYGSVEVDCDGGSRTRRYV